MTTVYLKTNCKWTYPAGPEVPLGMKKRKSKYGVAKKADRTLDGIVFHSKGEKNRYAELLLLQRAGKISDLVRQPVFQLQVRGPDHLHVIGHYRGDFGYVENGELCAEDFKGADTPLSKWKRAHVEAQYGIKIRITGAARKRGAA